jgi:hypothetical protein
MKSLHHHVVQKPSNREHWTPEIAAGKLSTSAQRRQEASRINS